MSKQWLNTSSNRGQCFGMRYIRPAEPVYHVHPPRPVCGATE